MQTRLSECAVSYERPLPGRKGPALAKGVLLAIVGGPMVAVAYYFIAVGTSMGWWTLGLLLLAAPALLIYGVIGLIAITTEIGVYAFEANTAGIRLKYLSTVLPMVPGTYYEHSVAWNQVAEMDILEYESESDPADSTWALRLILTGVHPGRLRVFTISAENMKDRAPRRRFIGN